MNELIEKVMADEELSEEDKVVLIERIVNASHGIDRFVTPGLYLHTAVNQEEGVINMSLWYRNEDENGMTDHGPTNYNSNTIVSIMKKECLNKKVTR